METKYDTAPATLCGTKTEENLHTAFSAEAQAYLRYKWYEKKAKEEGYIAAAQLFAATARNEREHAEIWFRYLGGYGSTVHDLGAAAEGEHFEWSKLYAQFAAEAEAEGFAVIARRFRDVAEVEKQHEQNYLSKQKSLQTGQEFAKPDPNTQWICLSCGHVASGAEPPAQCPVCGHPQGYFTEKKGQGGN